jgi:hypothetical protein
MGFPPTAGPVSPSRSRQSPGAASCPACGSWLVQPQGWKELPGGDIVIHLRCPECLVLTSESFEQREVAELDSAFLRHRNAVVADYELVVHHNMSELLRSFRRALELDLIGPDDFTPRRAHSAHSY